MIDLEAIRRRHRKAHSSWLGDYCVECGEWPCDASALADEVERLRDALECVANEGCVDDRCQGDCGYWIARKALGAK